MFEDTYVILIFFSAGRAWMCPQCAFILSWPQLYLWVNFHYNSIIHQKIELSVPLQRWKTLKILSNQALYSHCKKKEKKQPADFQANSIKSHIHDIAVCRHVAHTLLLFLSMTHWERSFTGLLTITFLKSASFRGKAKGWQWATLAFPPGAVSKHDALWSGRGLPKWPSAFAPARQTQQTERCCVLK